MKAIKLRKTGPPENLNLEEVPDPLPGPNDVIVKLKAAALNHRDIWIRTGKYAGIKLPVIPGSDGAGIVEAAGDKVDKTFIGREVIINPAQDWGENNRVQGSGFRILGLPDNGTYAERVKVNSKYIHQKPEGISFEEAAAIPLASLTAYRAVMSRAEVKPGQNVLITGIGGGVALFALQIALHARANVYVTSSSNLKIKKAVELGANGGVNYTSKEWVKECKEISGKEGIDVIIDGAGGNVFDQLLDIVKPGGKVITYGATLGTADKLHVRRIFWKQLNIHGTTMGTEEDFTKLVGLFGSGKLKPVIDKIFTLKDAPAAHRRMEEGEQFGKIILRID